LCMSYLQILRETLGIFNSIVLSVHLWANLKHLIPHLIPHPNTTTMWKAALSQNIVELRFILSNIPKHTPLLRSYIVKNQPILSALNPLMPITVREGAHIAEEPYMLVQYDWGKEDKVFLGDCTTHKLIDDAIKAASDKGAKGGDVSDMPKLWFKDATEFKRSGQCERGLPTPVMDGSRKRDQSTL